VTTPSDGNFFVRHPEVGALRFRQHELLDERAGVEQRLNAFARGELAFGALFRGGFRIAFGGFLF
jgi:hypothetical protein